MSAKSEFLKQGICMSWIEYCLSFTMLVKLLSYCKNWQSYDIFFKPLGVNKLKVEIITAKVLYHYFELSTPVFYNDSKRNLRNKVRNNVQQT